MGRHIKINIDKTIEEQSRRYHAPGISRREKGELLSLVQKLLNCGRRQAKRVMAERRHLGGASSRSLAAGGRPRLFSAADERLLLWLHEQMRHPAADRFHAALSPYLEHAAKHYPRWRESSAERIRQASAATIGRALKRRNATGAAVKRRRSDADLRSQIPINTSRPADIAPGNIDVDTVAHAGGTLAGQTAWTLHGMDVGTGFRLKVMLPNLRCDYVTHAMTAMLDRFPFPVQRIHCDQGSEFINREMMTACARRGVAMTRSRAGKCNDNPRIESANFFGVRREVGYGRFDSPALLEQGNLLYGLLERHDNWFCASVKLASKSARGLDGKCARRFTPPLPPLDRALKWFRENGEPAPRELLRQEALRRETDPIQLSKDIRAARMKLFRLQMNHRRNRAAEEVA